MDDLTDYLILYFLITGVLSLILSTFFTDRKIGMLGVLGISLIFSPIVGLIVGLSSEKVKSKPTTKLGKFKHHKEQLLKKIELLKKEDELGLLDDNGRRQLEELRTEYLSMDETQIMEEIERNRTEKLQKVKRENYYILIIVFVLILLVVIVSRF